MPQAHTSASAEGAATTTVGVRLLGPPRIFVSEADGVHEIDAPRLKRVWLLLLRLAVSGAATPDELTELLWDAPEYRSPNSLNTVLSATRAALGPAAQALAGRGDIRLAMDALPVDVRLSVDVRDFFLAPASTTPLAAVDALALTRGRRTRGERQVRPRRPAVA